MQFTTAKKKQLTVKQAEKYISHFQMQCDEMSHRCMNAERLLLFSHLIDFHPCVLKYLIPIFVSENAMDFLIKNHNEVERKFNTIDLINYGKIYRNVVEIFGLNPSSLAELKEYYLSINPAK